VSGARFAIARSRRQPSGSSGSFIKSHSGCNLNR
jgi:hypothetical protein